MKECNARSLKHTRCHFDIFNALSNWAVNEAGGGKKVFGTKAQVADYTPTDLGAETQKALESNLANYPDIAALLDKILPGYGDMLKQGGKNTLSLLKGEIPQDVQDSLRRSSAFKALKGGYAGSAMDLAGKAESYGETSLGLSQLGGNAAQNWAAIAQRSASPFLISGPQQAEMTFKNNLGNQATQQFKYNIAAAPDPSAAGIFNLQTALGAMAASFGLSSAASGLRGGGAGVNPGVGQGGYGWDSAARANAGVTGGGGGYGGGYNGAYSGVNFGTPNFDQPDLWSNTGGYH